METNIQKWGNSLAVRLPRQIAKKLSMHEGTRVRVAESEDGIVVQVMVSPQYTRTNLIKGISPKNVHHEYDFGESQGKEIW